MRIAELLPAGIVVVETGCSAPPETLHVEERRLVASAVPKRVVEFATGRSCAREALAQLGIRGFPLLVDARRAPRWPAGIVGSITHATGLCAAAIGCGNEFAGIGIDVELDGSVGVDMWASLFTDAEIAWLKTLPAAQRDRIATVLFSGKESFYKAQYSITGEWLDFNAVAVSIQGDGWHLQVANPKGALAQLRQPVSGRFAFTDRYVITAIAIPAFSRQPEEGRPDEL